MASPRTPLGLLKKTVTAWSDDYAPSMGAAISYYTLFSIAPLLIIVIALAGAIFGEKAARGQIVGELAGVIGVEAARTIEAMLDNAWLRGGGWAAVIGVVTLVFGATAAVSELQSALDRIWRTPEPARTGGLWGLVRRRLLSFSLILGLVFLLLVSLAVSAALTALQHWTSGLVAHFAWLFGLANHVVSFAVVTMLFAMIYKLLPRERIGWRDVWVGALATSALFAIGKLVIGLYLEHSSTASAYGAAGSLIVLLLWVYYSAQIFLLGAEFTWVYAYAPSRKICAE